MIQARVIQRIGGLAGVELYQPRLAVTGNVWFAEESYHHAESVAARVDDRRAEDRAKADLRGRIDERKIRSRLINVFNQYAPIRRKQRSRKITECLDLLRGETGKGGHLKSLAGAFRQKQQHAEIGFLQRGDGSKNVIQQTLQFKIAGKPHAEIVKAFEVAALGFQLVAQTDQIGAKPACNHF